MDEARKIKEDKGYIERNISYNPPICVGKDEYGRDCDYHQQDLNKIILSYVADYAALLKNSLNQLLSSYGSSLDTLPILITGGGCRLNGFIKLLAPSFPNRELIYAYSRTIGAREPSYAALLGLLSAAYSYKGSLVDNSKGVITVVRGENKQKVGRKDPDDDEI